MSFFKNIKKAFGFGPDDDELDDAPAAAPDESDAQPALAPAAQEVAIDANAEAAIFDKVVEVIDASLPEFLGATVDRKKQTEYLLGCLDESMQAYLRGLRASVMAECEARWAQERNQLQASAEGLRARAQQLEEKKEALNDSKLSADRQRRALADRVHDLEEQVLKLESDKEQLEIENKAMLNKTKAAAVLEADGGASALEAAERVAEMQTALDQAKAELAQTLAEREDLAKKSAEQEKALEAAQVKDKMNAAMFDDFKRQAAEATRALKEEQDAAARWRSDKETLLARIDDMKRECAEKDARLQEQVASLDEIAKIQEQVALFDDVRRKMDDHMARLKSSLKAAQEENASLRDTIKNNMAQSADDQRRLQQRIDELQEQLQAASQSASFTVASDAAPAPAPKRQRKRTVVLEDVDELIQGADWMVATPPAPTSMRSNPDDDTFGYQPPQRKQRPADADSQPSLFD